MGGVELGRQCRTLSSNIGLSSLGLQGHWLCDTETSPDPLAPPNATGLPLET